MMEMVRVNGQWAPAAEVEADLIRTAGAEYAAEMMKWARETGKTATTEAEMKAADAEIKAAVSRMWDELLPSRRQLQVFSAPPPVSPIAAPSTRGPCEGATGTARSGSDSMRAKEADGQQTHDSPAASSAPVRPERHRPANDVRQSASPVSTSDKPEPEYLTAAQAAEILQVSPKSVYRWAAADATMPVLRIGGVVRFPRERLFRWLRGHEQGLGRARPADSGLTGTARPNTATPRTPKAK